MSEPSIGEMSGTVADSVSSGNSVYFVRFDQPDTELSVVLEDDGRTAYAYLLQSGKVAGDVWLYNVGPDPERVDWSDPSGLPFSNPARFCSSEQLARLDESDEIVCEWFEHGVSIWVSGLLWARMELGSKPGWSRKAALPGPLAKPLEVL